MRSNLREWILQTRSTDFLHEAEMMIRSQASTPYDMAQNPDLYDLPRILAAAETVGDDGISISELTGMLQDKDSGVRFWAATALLAMGEKAASALDTAKIALADESPSVQNVAAEILCKLGHCEQALATLAANLQDSQRPWVVLHAARCLANIEEKAIPLLPIIKKVSEQYRGDAGGRYKDWLFSMFIGFALDQVFINCGEPT